MSAAQERLQALLRKHNVGKLAPNGNIPFTAPKSESIVGTMLDTISDTGIVYHENQRAAIDLILSGKSCVITGPAGSGKTTTIKGAIAELMLQNSIGNLGPTNHKHLRVGSPSILCTSFTNKAVQNMKKALPKDLHANCITVHKALEFHPKFYEYYDDESGMMRNTMQFVPKRTQLEPLPHIDCIVIDEAQMLGVDLWNLLVDAIKAGAQIILIGDIHQLPPVFGKSIFIWAMQLGAETVELTHIYRQALKSPIIRLATRVREGKQIPAPELASFEEDSEHGKLTIRPWKKSLSELAATVVMSRFLPGLVDEGTYNPITDIILTPYNKAFGTISLNATVASHLASIETDPIRSQVWEIFAGINKVYVRVGEKVLYNKSEAFIVKIEPNINYYGQRPRAPSSTMDYNGVESDPEKTILHAAGVGSDIDTDETIEHMLAQMSSHTEGGDSISREASHKITLNIPDIDTTVTVSGSGDVANLSLAYALTVHKSLGSEYNRVFFITHKSQANMFYRELLYTGVTRAAKELYVICEPNLFVKGITSQRLPGTTLEEKLENFDKNVKLGKSGNAERPNRVNLLLNQES